VSGEDGIAATNSSSGWLSGKVHTEFQLASVSLGNSHPTSSDFKP